MLLYFYTLLKSIFLVKRPDYFKNRINDVLYNYRRCIHCQILKSNLILLQNKIVLDWFLLKVQFNDEYWI